MQSSQMYGLGWILGGVMLQLTEWQHEHGSTCELIHNMNDLDLGSGRCSIIIFDRYVG